MPAKRLDDKLGRPRDAGDTLTGPNLLLTRHLAQSVPIRDVLSYGPRAIHKMIRADEQRVAPLEHGARPVQVPSVGAGASVLRNKTDG